MVEVTQELKPCPFCGGKAKWVEDNGDFDTLFGLVPDHSENCFLGQRMMENWDNIISAWNTRASTAPDAEPVACVGCEGRPAAENNPCAVCGLYAHPAEPVVQAVEVLREARDAILHYSRDPEEAIAAKITAALAAMGERS